MNLVRYGSWIGGNGFSHNRGNGGWYGYGLRCLTVVVWMEIMPCVWSYIVPGYRWPFRPMTFYPAELHITWQERLYMVAMEVRRAPA